MKGNTGKNKFLLLAILMLLLTSVLSASSNNDVFKTRTKIKYGDLGDKIIVKTKTRNSVQIVFKSDMITYQPGIICHDVTGRTKVKCYITLR